MVARTWQETAAPRSGCVRTRSLIVPTARWLSMDGIRQVLPLLVPVDFDEKLARLAPATSSPASVPVSDPRRAELVEALFFQIRHPIVVFDCAEAEPIVERLLAAFLPALKQSFSISTYALAPRKIEGRPFDLVFAPKGARARFSDWSGRRVDGASKPERHPWSRLVSVDARKRSAPTLLALERIEEPSSWSDSVLLAALAIGSSKSAIPSRSKKSEVSSSKPSSPSPSAIPVRIGITGLRPASMSDRKNDTARRGDCIVSDRASPIRSSGSIINAASAASSADFWQACRQCDDCGDEKKRRAQLDETELLMTGGQKPFRDDARRSQHAVNEPIKHRALLVAVLDHVLQ